MRLNVVKSKNAASFYVIKSFRENGHSTSKIVEKLGTEEELRERLGGQDPYEWAKAYVHELNLKEDTEEREVVLHRSPTKRLEKGKGRLFSGGYLFLQDIYHDLGIGHLCSEISKRFAFDFNLDAILSRLIFNRILYPGSKRSCMESSLDFLEPPGFELHQIYRALDVLAKESDFLEAEIYKRSCRVCKRKTGILYYDCTNFFFELESEDGLKQYGLSKEHRPNPIVQMGLFMDGDGIPLAFSINPGNQNEQLSLKPIEKRILSDFNLSRFVVCTDAGLSSATNRRFNTLGERAYVVTQSIKKLKGHLKEWALAPGGWSRLGASGTYDLSLLSEDDLGCNFYKDRWINENGIEERLIVTFSPKYQAYQRLIRSRQLDRAVRAIDSGTPFKKGQNDYKRFISTTHVTDQGEVAGKSHLCLDQEKIAIEERFDGFYAVTTCLEDDPIEIIRINKNRWQIEECFRIMKTDFEARPVYLQRDDRIKAHFLTCFLALLIYRILEKKLGYKYTVEQITETLANFRFSKISGEGYEPMYTRTDLTDDLHLAFGFETDRQIITEKEMKKIFRKTKH